MKKNFTYKRKQLEARQLEVLTQLSNAASKQANASDAGTLPLNSKPLRLSSKFTLVEAAECVLLETFCQFSTNLNTLRTSGEGIEVEPGGYLAAQPAPDYEVDQRVNW